MEVQAHIFWVLVHAILNLKEILAFLCRWLVWVYQIIVVVLLRFGTLQLGIWSISSVWLERRGRLRRWLPVFDINTVSRPEQGIDVHLVVFFEHKLREAALTLSRFVDSLSVLKVSSNCADPTAIITIFIVLAIWLVFAGNANLVATSRIAPRPVLWNLLCATWGWSFDNWLKLIVYGLVVSVNIGLSTSSSLVVGALPRMLDLSHSIPYPTHSDILWLLERTIVHRHVVVIVIHLRLLSRAIHLIGLKITILWELTTSAVVALFRLEASSLGVHLRWVFKLNRRIFFIGLKLTKCQTIYQLD